MVCGGLGGFFLQNNYSQAIGYESRKKSTCISHEMDNAYEKLLSGSNKASVFILYVSVIVYVVTLLIVSPFCFSNC